MAIKDQYAGKTAEQVWDEWTYEQKVHFIRDHHNENHISDFYHSQAALAKYSFKKLPRRVVDVLEMHISGGQYKEGGAMEARKGIDTKDTIRMDIPLLIRTLELAREDIKSDADLHRMVERLLKLKDKGVLTMDDYDFIEGVKNKANSMRKGGSTMASGGKMKEGDQFYKAGVATGRFLKKMNTTYTFKQLFK